MNLLKRIIRILPSTKRFSDRRFNELQKSIFELEEQLSDIKFVLSDLGNEQRNINCCLKTYAKSIGIIEEQTGNIESFLKKNTPLPSLNFIYHLTEHCNLNCYGCDQFSPVAEESYTDINVFRKDLKRLAELFGEGVRRINLVGGEPLLNSNASEFAKIARSYFLNAEIAITTNGLLLCEQSNLFWEEISENRIRIEITKYPIKLPIDKIRDKAKKYNVLLGWYCNVNDDYEKKMMHMPLDVNGKGSAIENWSLCYHANKCITVKDGKIYPCSIVPCVKHFNIYFHKNLIITNKDYIDIHTDITANDIMSFLSNPIPFCRYCNTKKRKFIDGWKISDKSISEWT